MNDDLTILATTYLDNTAALEERAQVETSPELLAEVERQRLIRAVLADVEAPSISLREQHLSSALEAWDRLPAAVRTATARDTTPSGLDPATAAAAATISTPPPTSLAARRRSKATGWVIGAAAALALVAAAGVVLQNVRLGDSDDSSSSGIPAEVDSQPDPNSSTAIADDAAEEFQQESELSAEAGEELADDPVVAAGEISAEESEEGGLDIDAEAPPQNDDLEVLSTPEQLGIFASDAISAPISPESPSATDATADRTSVDEDQSSAEEFIEEFEFPLCAGVDYVVGPAEYQGEFVVVAIDESRNLAVAYLALDCSVIEIAQLP
jgi:hypothetical protein